MLQPEKDRIHIVLEREANGAGHLVNRPKPASVSLVAAPPLGNDPAAVIFGVVEIDLKLDAVGRVEGRDR